MAGQRDKPGLRRDVPFMPGGNPKRSPRRASSGGPARSTRPCPGTGDASRGSRKRSVILARCACPTSACSRAALRARHGIPGLCRARGHRLRPARVPVVRRRRRRSALCLDSDGQIDRLDGDVVVYVLDEAEHEALRASPLWPRTSALWAGPSTALGRPRPVMRMISPCAAQPRHSDSRCFNSRTH